MNFKKILENTRILAKIMFLTILGCFIIYSIYYTSTNKCCIKYEDCGQVISKSDQEVRIKHGYRTELYLNVQFKKSGFRAINVCPTTYFNYNKGDYICFDLDKEDQGWHNLLWICGAIFEFIIILALIVLFITWIFGGLE